MTIQHIRSLATVPSSAMNEFTICEKRVDNQGDTYWAFSNSIMMCDDKPPEKETNENHMCTIKPSPGKGFGLFAKNNEIPSGTNLFSEKSYACLPIGKHRARVCMNCLKFGHKKVKVSSDCSDIFFCSHECLNAMDDFTTLCGPLITQVSSLLCCMYVTSRFCCFNLRFSCVLSIL